ncbi:MAG: prepilin-type N-terminal cleavage/methylation domain-containing protein [bacterium]
MTELRSFTLIELLIVVAIIGILAAIAVPNFLNAQTRAKISRIQADQKSVSTALEQYRLDHNSYPPDATNRYPVGLYLLTSPVAYIQTIPRDPFLSIEDKSLPIDQTPNGPFFAMGTDTELPNRVGTYALAAAGPDHDDDTGNMTGWPATVWWDFDPSNGLSSNGDIMYLGGSYSHGTFVRNGVPNR